MEPVTWTRAFVIALAIAGASAAQSQSPPPLPLQNLGLEHLDIVVPDPAAAARFYARIFKTTLHQQPLRDTIRYFVLLGDLPADRQVGYIAIGAAAPGRAPSIGHYCVLAKVYDRAGLKAGSDLEGPVIIESSDTTIVVPPTSTAHVDEIGNVIIKIAG